MAALSVLLLYAPVVSVTVNWRLTICPSVKLCAVFGVIVIVLFWASRATAADVEKSKFAEATLVTCTVPVPVHTNGTVNVAVIEFPGPT